MQTPGVNKGKAGNGPRQKPHKVEAFDRVAVQSPDMIIPRCQHLVVCFKDIPAVDDRLPDVLPAAPPSQPEVFDADATGLLPLVEAVKAFQDGLGLNADGVVGPATVAALNGGSATTKEDIIANMERWRWLPHDLGPFYVTVNIPEFTLRVVEEDEPIHTARVVVGKRDTQTPVISDEMETVVFNPYWNVPNSIKNEEIAPYFGQGGGGFFGGGWDTSVLRRHGLRLKYGNRIIDPDTVDWSRHDLRSFDLVQPPGPTNVLGKVKFLFPNPHDVYMHDTSAPALFTRSRRDFSHGCVRVEDPVSLAAWVLKDQSGWTRDRILEAMSGSLVVHDRRPR